MLRRVAAGAKMILKGQEDKHQVVVLECDCGNHEESLRLSFWEIDDTPELFLVVTRPKVSFFRYIADWFSKKFWVEIVLHKKDAEELARVLSAMASKLPDG